MKKKKKKNLWKTVRFPRLSQLMFFLMVSLSPLALTSCHLRIRWHGPTSTVRWAGVTYVVPWYVVWIPAILFTAVVLLLCQRHYTSKQYRCPACGHVFQPRFWEISVLLHQNDEHVMRCPQCGRKGFCKPNDT